MASKSRVIDGPAGGVVVQISDQELMLLGFREELLVLAQEQVFDITMAYKAVAASVEKTVECTFSAKRFRELRLPQSIKNDTKKVGGYFHFHLNGIVHYSPEGLVFGVLPLPKQ